MSLRRTTRCCCLGAAIALATLAIDAQTALRPPLSLFPVRADWNLPLGNLLVAPPLLTDAAGYFSIEGDRVVAYDLTTGSQQWLVDGHPTSQPATSGDLLFLAEANEIRALERATGTVRWRLPFSDTLAVPLVWDNGWLVAATESGTVLAFRANDGTLIWRQELGLAAGRRPALAADRVYVPLSDGRIVALQVSDGATRWERWVGGAPGDLLATDDRLYVGSSDNYFYGVRARNGDVEWRYATGADVVGLPIIDERLVYFVSLDNVLRALDKRTGVQHWKRPLALRPTNGPVRVGPILLVNGLSPKVPAYALKDGAPAGDIATGALLVGAPHVVPGGSTPRIALVIRDLDAGTIVRALVRSLDPDPSAIAPLPNPVSVPAPAASSPAPPPVR